MIDFSYGISRKAIAFAHYLALHQDDKLPGLVETLSEALEAEKLSIETRAHYEGRERGILFVIQTSLASHKALVFWFAEFRGSEDLFLQSEVSSSGFFSSFSSDSYLHRVAIENFDQGVEEFFTQVSCFYSDNFPE